MANDSKKNGKENESEEGKASLAESLKKVLTTSVGAAFMSEEAIRAYLGELKLPKEILSTILASANKSKEDITLKVSKEIIGIVQKIDFVKEFSKFAETHKFKISAEIDIIKKDKESKE